MLHTDIIIVGGGLSGIGEACHLERKNKRKSYRILEAREELGGTWSLFKYPGIRSDSDMYTFGYSFKTWDHSKSFADAPTILKYLNEAVDEYQIRDKIQYQTEVTSVNFDTTKNIWTVNTTSSKTNTIETYTCNFLFICTGYYNYKNGYTPKYPGIENYKGKVIHPQHWPEDLDYKGKKVVVIGSGATAVTIVPKMADDTAHITMLQRSPTYVGAFPNKDKVAAFLKKILPKKAAHKIIRFKNILTQVIFFNVCKWWPNTMRKLIIKGAQKELGTISAEPHFAPNYKPWDQRFCVAPDGDLFKSIKKGKASIVTDQIETFTENGIKIKSGEELKADIIISATGLKLLAFGGAKATIDGKEFDISKSLTYRGLMLSGLPNCIFFAGYTNASWTLKSDLTSEYANRLLKFMEKKNYTYVIPQIMDDAMETLPLLNLNSSYIHRDKDMFPLQGSKTPWKLYQNYFRDYKTLRINKITDKQLQFK
ncbi:flavin-containing monooxygenase [Polaribacter gochangensis]|uniref:flavin-containing monooxygenase n=1 Tax=Polaribacter gochangensis TaxID=3252903 RepID=UPI00390492BA